MKICFAENQFALCLRCFQSAHNRYVDRRGDLIVQFPNNLKRAEALQKKQSSNHPIFSSQHGWTASAPRKQRYVDRRPDLDFPKNLKKTQALHKINFSSSEKLSSRHMLGLLPIGPILTKEWRPGWSRALQKLMTSLPTGKFAPNIFNAEARCADHSATGAMPSRNFDFSLSDSLIWLQSAGFRMGCSCGKTIFQVLIICYNYPDCSYETQRSLALQKKIRL